MRKQVAIFLPIFILTGILHTQILFANRDEDANKYYLDAYNLYKLGKMDESLEALNKVLEINPDHAEAHFGIGSIYFRQNLLKEAVEAFTRVTRIKPEYIEAHQRLWLVYKKLGMNDKAEEELLKYKKHTEKRMQAMGGGTPQQVTKPATPPSSPSSRGVENKASKPEESTVGTPGETKVAETRPETGAKPEESGSLVVEPSKPHLVQQARRPVQPGRPAVKPVRPAVEPPRTLSETRLTAADVEPDADPSSPYIKVDRKNPAHKHLFKPFRKVNSVLLQNPFKKIAEKWNKSYAGKFFQGLVYYIVGVQVWLGIVATLCVYFRKVKKE
jgi:tetratricopeptide (TPR) repeat protein